MDLARARHGMPPRGNCRLYAISAKTQAMRPRPDGGVPLPHELATWCRVCQARPERLRRRPRTYGPSAGTPEAGFPLPARRPPRARLVGSPVSPATVPAACFFASLFPHAAPHELVSWGAQSRRLQCRLRVFSLPSSRTPPPTSSSRGGRRGRGRREEEGRRLACSRVDLRPHEPSSWGPARKGEEPNRCFAMVAPKRVSEPAMHRASWNSCRYPRAVPARCR